MSLGIDIDEGLLQYDTHYSGKGDFWRDTWQVVSRFTWELPQTCIGYSSARLALNFGKVEDVSYYGGAKVLRGGHNGLLWGNSGPAITIGSYIIGDRDIEANPENNLFWHEYGHYLQSRVSGWYYLQKYGMTSLVTETFMGVPVHNDFWVEQDADARAETFFNGNYHRKNFRETNPQWYEYLLIALPVTAPYIIFMLNRLTPAP